MRRLILVVAAVACVNRTSSGSGDTQTPPSSPAMFTLTVGVSGSGTVRFLAESCANHCVVQLPAGALHLDATANPGSHFVSWSAMCAAASCEVTIGGDLTLTASFAQDVVEQPPPVQVPPHILSVAVVDRGRVVSSPAGIDCPGSCSTTFPDGTHVLLTATPDAGVMFDGFSGACAGMTCAVSMTGDASVIATFEPIRHKLSVGTVGNGTVVSSPTGINCPGTCLATFAEATTVVLTPKPAPGARFIGFSGACTGTTCSLTSRVDAAVTASFAPEVVDECSGMMPRSLPPPVVPPLSCRFGCISGLSDDGEGNFLLHYSDNDNPGFDVFGFFAVRNGAATQTGSFGGTDEFPSQTFSEPAGFTHVVDAPAPAVFTYSAAGSLQSAATVGSPGDRGLVVPVPAGGFVTLTETADPTAFGFAMTNWQRFDRSGQAVTGSMPVLRTSPDTVLVSSGASLLGNTLVQYLSVTDPLSPRTLRVWVGPDGAPLTRSFAGAVSGADTYQFLLDGGLLELNQGSFVAVWRDGATQASPLPSWLEARRGAEWLAPIRRGAGYAMGGTCAGIEVLAKNGKSCGCLPVPGLSAAASIGRDGSLTVPRSDHFELYPLLFH